MIFTKHNINDVGNLIETAHSEGIAILIDKPLNWTSFDVIAKLRYLIKIKKIGHAGTLDPLADGLLIVCAGKYTKKINEFQDLHKEYSGLVKLGATTPSYDSEFDEENICDISAVTETQVIEAGMSFIGKQMQYPPAFSAKKIKGKKLYEYARKGITVEIHPNEVEFLDVKISYAPPFADFYIKCSKGTYIRSFANDMGVKLGVGGYLAKLRRTAIGQYRADDAVILSDLVTLLSDFHSKN